MVDSLPTIAPAAPAPEFDRREHFHDIAARHEADKAGVAPEHKARYAELTRLMANRREWFGHPEWHAEFQAIVSGKDPAARSTALNPYDPTTPPAADPHAPINAPLDRNDTLYTTLTKALTAEDRADYDQTLFDLGEDVGNAIVGILNQGTYRVVPLYPAELEKWASRSSVERQLAKEWGGRAALLAAGVDRRLDAIFAEIPENKHAHARTAFNTQRANVRRQILIALAADTLPSRR